MSEPCNMGVGCDEYGVCYADAHGEPERCGRPNSVGIPFRMADKACCQAAVIPLRTAIYATGPDVVSVRKVETVTGDILTEPGEPFWRIEIDGYCADFDYEAAAVNFAAAINRLVAERETAA